MNDLKAIAKKLIMDAVENKHITELPEEEIDRILERHDFDVEDIFYNALIEDLVYKIFNVWNETGF